MCTTSTQTPKKRTGPSSKLNTFTRFIFKILLMREHACMSYARPSVGVTSVVLFNAPVGSNGEVLRLLEPVLMRRKKGHRLCYALTLHSRRPGNLYLVHMILIQMLRKPLHESHKRCCQRCLIRISQVSCCKAQGGCTALSTSRTMKLQYLEVHCQFFSSLTPTFHTQGTVFIIPKHSIKF